MMENTIWIVDDNEAVCASLKFLFDSYFGLKVIIYNNPLLFLEEFSSDWKGCLIIDLFMPSMNGIDLMKELKSYTDMRVIIISGHGTPEVAEQALKEGAYAFINKPFKIDTLLEKVNDVLAHYENSL